MAIALYRHRDQEKKSLDMVCLQVAVPRDNEIKTDAMEQVFNSLSAIKKGGLGQQNSENFENENEIKTDDGDSQEIEIFDGPEGQLAVDVFSIPTHFIIEAAIAGVKADDIDISITTDSVAIKGKRQREIKEENKDYLFQECFWGRFSRLITLPEEIDADKSHASFKNGILKIILPKINRQKSKKIKVKFD